MSHITIPTPQDFSFRSTIRSHGWYDLAPFVIGEEDENLRYVFKGNTSETPILGEIRAVGDVIEVAVDCDPSEMPAIERDVRRMLRLDENIADFYSLAARLGKVEWASRLKAGRLLRSPTVWEDLVKSICTTNCTWSVTRSMVAKLVDHLGTETSCGRSAFPTADAMAARTADFYRETIRAGYRSEYLAELSTRVASGEIDPESWLASELSTADLKKQMKRVKGVGDYAAENLLKLVGRYDGLALDSWLRAGFYKKHNDNKKCDDKKIERYYAKFGDWRGLAIWCDMTEDWFA